MQCPLLGVKRTLRRSCSPRLGAADRGEYRQVAGAFAQTIVVAMTTGASRRWLRGRVGSGSTFGQRNAHACTQGKSRSIGLLDEALLAAFLSGIDLHQCHR